MFDSKLAGKMKNDKIQRWKVEFAGYGFDIKYCPGRNNVAADMLSRAYCLDTLENLHNFLGHSGITQMVHFVKSVNLSFSMKDVKRVFASCPVCAESKP